MNLKSTGPVRTCIGCRTRRPSCELRRLSLDSDRRLKLDQHGVGRGAWLCATEPSQCLAKAVKSRALARAFRTQPDPASVDLVVSSLAAVGR